MSVTLVRKSLTRLAFFASAFLFHSSIAIAHHLTFLAGGDMRATLYGAICGNPYEPVRELPLSEVSKNTRRS